MRAKVIAEIGLHHGGDIERAKELILSAKQCGADAVKFQFFTERDLDGRAPGYGWKALKQFALEVGDLRALNVFAHENEIDFGCSFFGQYGINFASSAGLSLDFVKIPAPQSNSQAIIDSAELHFRFSDLIVSYYPTQQIVCRDRHIALHCTSGYPTPDEDLRLGRISTFPDECVSVGWSCHAEPRALRTPELACLAYAAGARVFEFHYRDDKTTESSPDYCVSLWPALLANTVQELRRVEVVM